MCAGLWTSLANKVRGNVETALTLQGEIVDETSEQVTRFLRTVRSLRISRAHHAVRFARRHPLLHPAAAHLAPQRGANLVRDVQRYASVRAHRADDPDGPLINGVKTACELSVDLRRLRRALQRKVSADGKVFWSLAFRVGVSFGGSQLRARIRWEEVRSAIASSALTSQAGVECEGTMAIVRDAVA